MHFPSNFERLKLLNIGSWTAWATRSVCLLCATIDLLLRGIPATPQDLTGSLEGKGISVLSGYWSLCNDTTQQDQSMDVVIYTVVESGLTSGTKTLLLDLLPRRALTMHFQSGRPSFREAASQPYGWGVPPPYLFERLCDL